MDFLSPEEEHRWPAPHKQWWLSSGLNLLMNNEVLCFPCFLSSSSNSHIKSCLQVGGERNRERALNEPEKENEWEKEIKRDRDVIPSKLALYVYECGKESDFYHLPDTYRHGWETMRLESQSYGRSERCQRISGSWTCEKVSNYKSCNKPTWLWACIVIKKV